MKSKKELNAQKEEVETVSKKFHELTDEELAEVSGGQDAQHAIVFTSKSAGIDNQISGICISVSDKTS